MISMSYVSDDDVAATAMYVDTDEGERKEERREGKKAEIKVGGDGGRPGREVEEGSLTASESALGRNWPFWELRRLLHTLLNLKTRDFEGGSREGVLP
jgi:hypothetical protein